ncbi:signal recognition particle-docking protein FtsY [Terriglobus tenax]|uniref:signal recognition particle-docking protein FtsY n=1 Tax=Terriglobus tenax TaxID=1111115 RepID=UPI0021E0AB11|nr:signal recognition particle-docking protein FtsY [Terriglobus tenax]
MAIQTLFGSLNDNEPRKPEQEEEALEVKSGFFSRMKQAVTRTRDNLTSQLDQALSFTRSVNESDLEDLEAILLTADIGLATTNEIISRLRERARRESIDSGSQLKDLLKQEIRSILDSVQRPVHPPATPPEVILMVGVNGTGKTTTSGKLAAFFQSQNRSALLCAADTFRAAAIEQLEVWSQRSGVPIIKTRQGGDPSAALFDALEAAKKRETQVVLVDTAGRLHTKTGLMAELDKMRRIAQKFVPGAPHQVFLVIDATTGQNGLQQARLFTESAGVTGIVLTKLDGTAKGGIVVAIAHELKLPVVFCGIGEKMEDLLQFDSAAFVEGLFN